MENNVEAADGIIYAYNTINTSKIKHHDNM